MTFGVMADELLLTRHGETIIPEFHPYTGFHSIQKLFNFAENNDLKQLWIAPGSDFWRNITAEFRSPQIAKTFWTEPGPWTLAKGGIKNTISAWIEGRTKSTRQILIPRLVEDSPAWIFDEIEDPYLLFQAIDKFRETVRFSPSFPWKVSFGIFERELSVDIPNLPAFYEKTPTEFWDPFISRNEVEFLELRQPGKDEKKLPFVHAFDKRAMFLTAARSAGYGVGNFEEIDSVRYDQLPKGTVGICEVEPLKFSDPLNPELAAFMTELFDGQTRIMTPYLEFFEKTLNHPVKIKKAWVWKKTHRVFEKWATCLIDGVKQTRGSDDVVLQTVNAALKPLYTKFFGWFGRGCECVDCGGGFNEACNRSGRLGPFYRPDWRNVIISTAQANLLRNVVDVYQYNRKLPFGIYHDCLMYFSDSDNPGMEFDKTDVMKPEKFTHEWVLPGKVVNKAIKDGENVGGIDAIGKAAKNG